MVFGENQPEYQPLPALALEDARGEVITCWEMTDEELEVIKKTKCIYLSQFTFNQSLQPIMLMAELGDNMKIVS